VLEVHFHASVAPPPDLAHFPTEAMTTLLREAGGPGEGAVHFVLTDDAELAALNERFRGVAGPTDVLAFPYDPAASGGVHGDVYVSLDRAREQAAERGEPAGREVWRLFVHGALHLAGHDHDTPKNDRAMRALQEAWVERAYPDRGTSR
jgi:probable rRNA maturation factor